MQPTLFVRVARRNVAPTAVELDALVGAEPEEFVVVTAGGELVVVVVAGVVGVAGAVVVAGIVVGATGIVAVVDVAGAAGGAAGVLGGVDAGSVVAAGVLPGALLPSSQAATPPWCEQLPECVAEKL